MAMFPIFMIGLVAGIILSTAYNVYKRETPSEAQLHILQKALDRETKDKERLSKLVDELYEKIDELENNTNNVK